MKRPTKLAAISLVAAVLSLGVAWDTLAQNMFKALQYRQQVIETTKAKKFKNYGTRSFQNSGGDGIEGEMITVQYFGHAQPRSGSKFKGKGNAQVTHRCAGNDPDTGFFTQTVVHQETVAFDKNGAVNSSATFDADAPCTFFFTDVDFTGNVRMTGPGTFNEMTTVKRPGSGACAPDGNTLCLNDDRFQVEVEWRTSSSQAGQGSAVAVQHDDDSGLLFFLDPDDTDALIKILDGCSTTDHFWVFFAAATDVEYTLTVTDTQSGQARSYFNPLGQPADAILDTQAFATCP